MWEQRPTSASFTNMLGGRVLAPPSPQDPSPEGRELGTAGQRGEEQPETAGQRPGSEPHFPFLPRESRGGRGTG